MVVSDICPVKVQYFRIILREVNGDDGNYCKVAIHDNICVLPQYLWSCIFDGEIFKSTAK